MVNGKKLYSEVCNGGIMKVFKRPFLVCVLLGSKLLATSAPMITQAEFNKGEVSTSQVKVIDRLFDSLDDGMVGTITAKELIENLRKAGILEDDPRIAEMMASIHELADNRNISVDTFEKLIQKNSSLVEKALKGDLIIPDFDELTKEITKIYETTKVIETGKVADYIPQLAKVSPEYYAISVCTIDGQRFSIGDSEHHFVVQSTSKPISYCMALEEYGDEYVHQFVGREPSGLGFNELALNSKGLPHNPMINAGAIMSCSLIKRDYDMSDRFDHVMKIWQDLSGDVKPHFNNAVYLSERNTGDRNYALGYFMQEKKAFPENTNLIDVLEFYFQTCSIEVTSDSMATIAATLANSGICPTTEKIVFQPDNVKDCLSLMSSCGMYDFSGEFAFTVGLPAKSGVSGAIMIVIPKVMGIAVWSPPLDQIGNSVRGIEFCKELVNTFNFHTYDNVALNNHKKKDPLLKRNEEKFLNGIVALCWAASQGDVNEIKHLVARGVDLNCGDYDGRTALHIAASEGRDNVVAYLLNKGVNIHVKDRWGNTPVDDARRGNHHDIIQMLQ